jgi:molybdopterin converting factor small subunit
MSDSIRVQVRFFNVLRDAAGRAGDTLSVPPDTSVRALVTEVIAPRNPQLAGILLGSHGDVSPYTRVFVNGALTRDKDLGTLLHDGDEVRIFPAIAGG